MGKKKKFVIDNYVNFGDYGYYNGFSGSIYRFKVESVKPSECPQWIKDALFMSEKEIRKSMAKWKRISFWEAYEGKSLLYILRDQFKKIRYWKRHREFNQRYKLEDAEIKSSRANS